MKTAIALIGMFGLAATALAGPVVPKDVADDAKWFVHIDMEAARGTVLYKQIREDSDAKDKIDAWVTKTQQATSFSPLDDTKSITLYGTSFQAGVGVALIYAKVDPAAVLKLLVLNPGYAQSTYGKHGVHTWTDNGKQPAGCFFGPELVVIGNSLDTLKGALDVLDGRKESKPALLKLPAAGAAVQLGATGLALAGPNVSPVVANAESISASLDEQAGKDVLTGAIIYKNAEQATQMKAILDGLKALAMLSVAKEPQTAEMLQQINTSVDGNRVTASLQQDAKTLLSKLKTVDAERKAREAAAKEAK